MVLTQYYSNYNKIPFEDEVIVFMEYVFDENKVDN